MDIKMDGTMKIGNGEQGSFQPFNLVTEINTLQQSTQNVTL